MADILRVMPELEGEELLYVRGLVEPMTDDDAVLFANAYRSQRRDSTNVLLLTLLGFVVLAGLQRFYVGQIGMGIAYLLTAGFCFIGTIIDLINHKSLALKYNQEKAANIVATMTR
jgi:TM2 domain-containing membrane protein YozV